MQALGNHPLILSGGEAPFVPYVGSLIHPFEFRYNKEYQLRVLQISKNYLYDKLRLLCIESALGKHFGLLPIKKNLLDLRENKFHFNLQPLIKHYWCVKTFPNSLEAKGLMQLYPKVKFIYIFRNGCDVVRSRSIFPAFRSMPFRTHCEKWTHHIEKYDYLSSLPKAILVRHEDVVDNPEKESRRILSFLGIDYDDGPANFLQTKLIHPLDQGTKEIDVKKSLKDRPLAYANWTIEQKEIFKSVCGDAMHKMGYEINF